MSEPIIIKNFIKDEDEKVHIDMERDMQAQSNGLFTFILRVDKGLITDYNLVKYVDANDYFKLTKVTVTEFTVARGDSK